eukprot:TRINITY_DN18986_c0_g1_i1.p1 TRINITY_DN18986_c0_g1~~TRINITY_DN18986_c0_g1_i1.p1  ORF type:complete len:861 (+),score=176.41 TRINITY_DN18986_c0_g1_i1:49-2631(+)
MNYAAVGLLLACVGVGSAVLTPVATLDADGSNVVAVAWSPDGALIAGGHVNGSVSVWDAATYTLVHHLRARREAGDAFSVAHLNFGAAPLMIAGRYSLAVAYRWNNLCTACTFPWVMPLAALVDVDGDGTPYLEVWMDKDFFGAPDELYSLAALSPGGGRLAVLEESSLVFNIYNATQPGDFYYRKGVDEEGVDEEREAGTQPASGVAWSPTGTFVATSMGTRLWFWHGGGRGLPTRALEHDLGEPCPALAFNANGTLLAMGCKGGSILFLRMGPPGNAPRVIDTRRVTLSGPVHAVDFAPDGNAVVAVVADGSLQFVDSAQPRSGRPHNGSAVAARYSPRADLVACTTLEGNINVYAADRTFVPLPPLPPRVLPHAASPHAAASAGSAWYSIAAPTAGALGVLLAALCWRCRGARMEPVFADDAVESALAEPVFVCEEMDNAAERLECLFPYSGSTEEYVAPEMPAEKKYQPGWVVSVRDLGAGRYGAVTLGTHTETNEQLVFNTLPLTTDASAELHWLQKLRHGRIAAVKGFYVDAAADQLLLYHEYVTGGSLHDAMAKRGRMMEGSVRRVAREVVQGLQYLHSRGVAHRDVNPKNIMVDLRGRVKLANFGNWKLDDAPGGPPRVHAAPEAAQGDSPPAAFACDLWSVGATIVHLASGEDPWHETGLEGAALEAHIEGGAGEVGHHPYIPDTHLSPIAYDAVLWCFEASPSQRPTCDELLDDEFLSNIAQPLKGIEYSDPSAEFAFALPGCEGGSFESSTSTGGSDADSGSPSLPAAPAPHDAFPLCTMTTLGGISDSATAESESETKPATPVSPAQGLDRRFCTMSTVRAVSPAFGSPASYTSDSESTWDAFGVPAE